MMAAAAASSFSVACAASGVVALLRAIVLIIMDDLEHLCMKLVDELLCRRLNKELFDKLLCRRFKDRRHCFHIAMAEEKAALRDGHKALLLQCYMCAIATFSPLQRYKVDWNSARPKSESTKAGTVSEFSTGKSNGRRNELTHNESHPSDADFAGAEHGIKEGKAKTSAAWVAATAAPHHATGNRDLLSGFIIEHDDQFVHAVDGIPRKVLARGAVITDSVVLPDVWFVPGLTENLVSVSQLVEQDHSVGFSCGECCVRSSDGKVVGKGHLQEGGLYVLDLLKVPLAI